MKQSHTVTNTHTNACFVAAIKCLYIIGDKTSYLEQQWTVIIMI